LRSQNSDPIIAEAAKENVLATSRKTRRKPGMKPLHIKDNFNVSSPYHAKAMQLLSTHAKGTSPCMSKDCDSKVLTPKSVRGAKYNLRHPREQSPQRRKRPSVVEELGQPPLIDPVVTNSLLATFGFP